MEGLNSKNNLRWQIPLNKSGNKEKHRKLKIGRMKKTKEKREELLVGDTEKRKYKKSSNFLLPPGEKFSENNNENYLSITKKTLALIKKTRKD